MNRVLLPIFALLAATTVSLSAQPSRPANCYIVAPEATLEFNGRLQGCSADTIEGDPAQAGVMWESAGADIKVKEGDVVASATFSKETGLITVKAGKTPGNALVVIEDAVSNVLWSWHIWVTDYDPSKGCYQQDAKGKVIMMDRNLGALSATPGDPLSLGLFYQWGRKDPFPGVPGDCVYNEGISISGLSSKNSAVTPDAIGYAIAHPTTLLYANDYQTWISTASQATAAQDLWTKTTRNKSNYDPCPAGYAVPWQNDYAWYTNFTAANMTFAASGFTFTYDAHSTYYPAAGYLNGLTLTDAGKTVRCWAANINGTPSATTNMQARSLLVDVSTNTVTNNASSRTAFGMSVRCMKI